jgi:hypothetical protein
LKKAPKKSIVLAYLIGYWHCRIDAMMLEGVTIKNYIVADSGAESTLAGYSPFSAATAAAAIPESP